MFVPGKLFKDVENMSLLLSNSCVSLYCWSVVKLLPIVTPICCVVCFSSVLMWLGLGLGFGLRFICLFDVRDVGHALELVLGCW